MAKSTNKHVHKYHKVNNTWKCALPDCTHFMPKNAEAFVLGKFSICWECNQQFILNESNMVLDKPICESCKLGVKDDVDFDEIVASIRKEIG